MTRHSLLVGIAAVCIGCSGGGHAHGATSTSTTALSYRATDVIAVESIPIPEGPALRRVRKGSPQWAGIAALLPPVLPAPLAQPQGCTYGNTTTLFLADGTPIDYGPCLRPPSIDAMRCVLAHAPIGCR